MAANVQSHYIGTDGNWASTTNWSLTRGGASKGAIPADDEDVFIENLTHPLAEGMDQSGIDLHNLFVTIGDGGSLGSSANPLQIGVSNTTTNPIGSNGTIPIAGPVIRNYGGAPVYFKSDTATDQLTLIGPSDFVVTGPVALLYCGQNGRLVLADGASIGTRVHTMGMGVELQSGTGSIAEIIAEAGSHRLDRSVTTLSLYGLARAHARRTAAMTTVNVFPASEYNHTSSGTIGTINVHNTAKALAAGASAPFTVTNANVYAGGRLFEGVPVVTYTNDPVKIGF